MIRVTGIVKGHYQCRSLDETVPILRELLALEVVSRKSGEVIVRHPNTDWPLVIHEAPAPLPDQPHYHHYGVRVAADAEVDNAHAYLQKRKSALGLKIVPPETRRIAHSVHFVEPGGNFWEIESYEGGAKKHGLKAAVAFPWRSALVDEQFSERGYVPQCLSHGTTTCANLERARHFYRSALGLDVMHPFDNVDPYYVKHPSAPWYIVCLQIPGQRVPTGEHKRFTLGVESAAAAVDAHRWLKANAAALEIAAPQEPRQTADGYGFLFTDPDGNCWEIVGQEN